MSKPWGEIGSWAAEAEAEDQELAAAAAAATTNNDLQSFPSLREAVTTKTKKKKISLPEFHGTGGGSNRSTGLTPDEMMQLPTGPKQRSPDELYAGNRLGGGFSNYGRSSSGPMRERDGDSGGNWGGRRSYGGFEDDRRGPPRRGPDYDLQPSRADEVDDWAADKRAITPPAMDIGRANRYGSLGGGSRADEVDSWALGKKPVAPAAPTRSSTFGSGHRASAMDSGRWRRDGEERERDSGRTRLVLDPPRGEGSVEEPPQPVEKTNRASPFGAARPREEILAEKGLDWKKLDLEMEAKKTVSSGQTSSHGSRPSSANSTLSENAGSGQSGQGLGSETVAKPRTKANPFADAKPREVLLEEKGKDWRKMDLELERRAVDRLETEEEKALKEEIVNLKKEFKKEAPGDDSQVSGADQTSLHDIIQLKERELETLRRELDDKVRFDQKAVERPGSGAGRFGSFSERLPSQPGSLDDARSMDSVDRPRSRGTADQWSRRVEDRRGSFHGGKGRGFLGSRDFDRSRSSQRW